MPSYDNISAMLGTGQDPREQQLAQALRGQQASGDMLGLSTIGSVSNLGQNINKRTNAAAIQGGALKQAMQEREARKKEAEAARAFTSGQADLDRAATQANSFASDERLAIRQQNERTWLKEAEMERLEKNRLNDEKNAVLRKENGIPGMNPNEKQQAAYSMAVNTTKVMRDMVKFIESMSPEQMRQADSVLVPMAMEFFPDDAARLVAEHFSHTDPNVRIYLTQGAKIENEFSRAMSGLAVTVFENSLRENWSPFVKGISQAERQRRMQDMSHELYKAQAAHEAVFGTKWRVIGEAMEGVENENPLVGANNPNDIHNMSIEDLNRIVRGGKD